MDPPVASRPPAEVEAEIASLLARLTLEEKVAMMAGSAAFTVAGVPRLDLPPLRLTDGPAGVRSHEGEAATVFPAGVALAASFDTDLVRQAAGAIAREALAFGDRVVLAPTINIVRTPLWGRAFETYSEDPHLTAEIGAAFVAGLQTEGVAASLKHFAVNNQERERLSIDARLDERTLREIYLAAFEAILRRSEPWTVMASYNKVEGAHACENRRLLTDILKREWGYDGLVMSDWGAVHSTDGSAKAGLDLEMPGPPRWFGEKLLAAVRAGEVEPARIDDAARRMLRLRSRTDTLASSPRSTGELRSGRHRAIARRAAEAGAVLLRNEGALLPFDVARLGSIAVIGPNAAARSIQGGGSSQVRPGRRVSLLDAIAALVGECCAVLHAEGGDNEPTPPPARAEQFSSDEGRGEAGLLCETFADDEFAGVPLRTRVERRLGKLVSNRLGATAGPDYAAFRWRGWFWPERDGRHEFGVRGAGAVRLALDGEALIGEASASLVDRNDIGGAPIPTRVGARDLMAGRGYAILVEYRRTEVSRGLAWEQVNLGVRGPRGSVAEAAALAAGADAAIVAIGAASTTEGEGYDRESLDLPGDQNALVEAVLAANPRTAIVLLGGAPYALPWIDHAPAVLIAWFAGEEGPAATARLLFGEAAPSGRLPVSWPRRIEDVAAQAHYPGAGGVARYGEGLFVGYRHFDRSANPPLFPFGHGLTYTRFRYADLVAPAEARAGEPVAIDFTLTNIGARAGAETAQLYVRPRGPSVERPVKELKAFAKVALAPGEARRVRMVLEPRAFAFWDVAAAAWRAEAGAYDLLVAASAADIELQATVRLSGEWLDR